MKKKSLWIALATIAAAVAVAGYYDHSQTEGFTPLQIANIESLSKTPPEVVIEYDKSCADGEVYCIPNYMGPIENSRPVNW